ncbi:MAG: type III-B CRISPR-associated protein Cas10/Cmr2 [Anaerolineae bacterium]|jgi:CRISPR-associated protein Cmr2
MNDAVLIFTFSPVQSFISEARRTGDLYAGSRILTSLAAAAFRAITDAGGNPVYPAKHAADRSEDIPNKLVAVVPGDRAAEVGRAAEEALHRRWGEIAQQALDEMTKRGIPGRDDPVWRAIWDRQTAPGYLWQCFWAAAPIGSDGYSGAYRLASSVVDASKRSRVFPPAEEPGDKDALSGRRQALHRRGEKARDYWAAAAERVTGAMLRPDGRERLDAIGAIKRFWPHGASFDSTSTVAASRFLDVAQERAGPSLARYREQLESVLGDYLYQPRAYDHDWPYDGDLLFEDTLAPQRLRNSYHVSLDSAALEGPRSALKELYHAAKASPSPYYAVIVLDGDSMGELISKLLDGPKARADHECLGSSLAEFSSKVGGLAAKHQARVIYNGGDDVLALAPAGSALRFAHALACEFNRFTDATASAGIAIAHHLSPLDAALEAAREAERQAKKVRDKGAVCVTLMRRGGEHTTARGRWEAVMPRLEEVVKYLRGGLSGRCAYDVARLAYSLEGPGDMLRSELKRLLSRYEGAPAEPSPKDLACRLNCWAAELPEGVKGLADWLIIARFLAGEWGGDNAAVP